MESRLVIVLLVAGGGAVGSVIRFLVSSLMNPHTAGVGFPYGTLLVNIVGCIAFGVLAALFREVRPVSDAVKLAILAGVLGGFTTYSSFGYESFALANNGLLRLAGLYIVATNLLCIAGAWIGYRVVEWIAGSK